MINYKSLIKDLNEIEKWCKENKALFSIKLNFVEDGKHLLASFTAENKKQFPLDGDLRPRNYND